MEATMKIWMKRIALTALSLCLCAAPSLALTLTGLETETVTREWETNAFFVRMQALTGVDVQAHGVDDEQAYEALLDGMLRGEIPADALFKAGLSREREIALLNSGAIIDLAPLIEEHMPNLSALFAAHPEWREVVELEDGRIASLPQLTEEPRQVLVWINSAWLKKLGVAMPQTVQELTAALQKMRDNDPNGNGKWDEIPADLVGVYEMRWLLPFFGVVADDYNVARDESGALVFAPELPGYRDFVATLRDWYERGLLPREAFTRAHNMASLDTGSQQDETVVSGLIVTVAPYTNVAGSAVLDYEPLLIAAPNGRTRWRDMLGGVWTGCFAVTSACEDIEGALRWVDALYGEEGALLAYAGALGEDYEVREDGIWAFLVDSYRTVNDIRAESIIYTGETLPGLVPSDFMHRVDNEQDRHVLDASQKALAFAERVVEPYALGESVRAQANALAAVIGAEVDMGIARFVTGELEMTDENWDAWLAALSEAGSGELVALLAK